MFLCFTGVGIELSSRTFVFVFAGSIFDFEISADFRAEGVASAWLEIGVAGKVGVFNAPGACSSSFVLFFICFLLFLGFLDVSFLCLFGDFACLAFCCWIDITSLNSSCEV